MRKRRGFTQEDVGRLLEVDPSQISHYEAGRTEPQLSSFRRMREAYGVTADELLAAFDAAKRSGLARRNGRRLKNAGAA